MKTWIIASIATILLCAGMYFHSHPEVEPYIELTKLRFNKKACGVVIPKKYGDVSLGTHKIVMNTAVERKNLLCVDFIPLDTEKSPYILSLWVKEHCPEAVALSVCDPKCGVRETWIYREYNKPIKVGLDEYYSFLIMEIHLCTVGLET